MDWNKNDPIKLIEITDKDSEYAEMFSLMDLVKNLVFLKLNKNNPNQTVPKVKISDKRGLVLSSV